MKIRTGNKFGRKDIVSDNAKKQVPATARQKGHGSLKSKERHKNATVIKTKAGVVERSSAGCYLRDPDGNQFICGWIGFTRLITNVDDGTVSVEIKYRNLENEIAHILTPMSDFSSPREIVKKLMNRGVRVDDITVAGMFIVELYRQKPPDKRAAMVSMPGWHKMESGQTAYIANGFTAGPQGCDTGLVLDPKVGRIFAAGGTLPEWNDNVGEMCRGNPFLILAICATLASPLLYWVFHNNFGIHIFCKTSEGKTSMYYVSASASGPIADIKDWNSTEKAFTAMAKQSNDSAATYDEIGSADARDVKKVAFHFMNGRDRGRANSDGTAAKLQPFRGVFLSNGEVDFPTFFAQAGVKIMLGQLVRFLNIPVYLGKGKGVFSDLHGYASKAEFAIMLQEKTSRYFGTVLPEFVRVIAEAQDTIAETANALIENFTKRLKRALPEGYQITGREERVIRCFALMACAGELAIENGTLAWKAGEAFAGVRSCFRAWVRHDRKIAPLTDDDVFAQIRQFFQSEGQDQFVRVADYDRSDAEHKAGFIKKVDGTLAYLVLPEYFESVICQRFGKTEGVRVLSARKLLMLGAEGRPRKQVQMPDKCGGRKKNYYVIRASITE